MTKHTPGPWRTGWLSSYDALTGEPEAFVYRLPPDDERETVENRIRVLGAEGAMDCDADARLIAAAPDLADALEVAWRTLGSIQIATAANGEHVAVIKATAQARAALRKAGRL